MTRRKHRINTPQYRDCFRCGAAITNPFNVRAWCDDCADELQQMSFTGEEVLDIVTNILPPTNLRAVLVPTIYSRAHEVLEHKGILDADEETNDDDDDKQGGVRSLLVHA